MSLEQTAAPTSEPGRLNFWLDLALALSVSNFCLIQAWFGLLFNEDFGYFNRIPVNRPSLASLVFNVFWLAAVLFLFGRIVRWRNTRWLWWFAAFALCASVLIPLNFVRVDYFGFVGSKVAHALKQPFVIGALALVAVAGMIFLRWTARI